VKKTSFLRVALFLGQLGGFGHDFFTYTIPNNILYAPSLHLQISNVISIRDSRDGRDFRLSITTTTTTTTTTTRTTASTRTVAFAFERVGAGARHVGQRTSLNGSADGRHRSRTSICEHLPPKGKHRAGPPPYARPQVENAARSFFSRSLARRLLFRFPVSFVPVRRPRFFPPIAGGGQRMFFQSKSVGRSPTIARPYLGTMRTMLVPLCVGFDPSWYIYICWYMCRVGVLLNWSRYANSVVTSFLWLWAHRLTDSCSFWLVTFVLKYSINVYKYNIRCRHDVKIFFVIGKLNPQVTIW